MTDIFHSFPISVSISEVFKGVSTPKGLNIWWCETSVGKSAIGENYKLSFGHKYNWTAIVSKFVSDKEFELTFTDADPDWNGTKVGFTLMFNNNITNVHFYHKGWKENNEHYRISCYCWAMYLRLLKRNLELGEEILYEDRLNV